MARRNKKGQFVKGSGGGRRKASRSRHASISDAITIVNAPAPRKRRSGGRTRVVHHRAAPRRRASSGGGLGSLGGLGKLIGGTHRAPILVGALALGFANQHGVLAKLPLLGKAGPITSASLLGWGAEELLGVKLPSIVRDAVTAGLAISAFNIGNTMGSAGGTQLVGQQTYPGGAVFFAP